jgi:hypothetical protein
MIHGAEKINFRVLRGIKAKNLCGTYEELEEKLQDYNDKGYDIHFVVNGGGTKGCDINKINAVYIDLDCGKEMNGKYFELSKVETLKKPMLEKVRNFIYKPSIILDTRNGYHVYWLLNDGAEIVDFLKAQLRLINYFMSDNAVKTLEHTMRVPDFYWMKDKQNKYMCSIIESNDVRYHIGDIIDSLPECKDEYNISGEIPRFVSIGSIGTNKDGDNLELIINKDAEGLRKVLFKDNIEEKMSTIFKSKEKGVELVSEFSTLSNIVDAKSSNILIESREELFNTIKQLNLIEFLGYGGVNCSCIFHEDHKPSASIFINEENGHWLYKCHSTNCDFDIGSIIDVVMRLQRSNVQQAVDFICEVYGIECIDNSSENNSCKKWLQENINYLQSGFMETQYPNLFNRIKRYLPILIKFNEIALEHSYINSGVLEEKAIFYASVRYISDSLGIKCPRRVGDRINLITFLGLIKKLDECDIPEDLLKKSKEIAEEKGY